MDDTNDQNDILTPDIRFFLIKRMERHKVIALAGPALLPHEEKYLEFHGVSGIVLFERNVESLSQVRELIASVTEQLSAGGLPPFVLADHEGDFVAVLRKIIGVPPSPMAIAATGDVGLAREVARETGLVIKKLGVNVVLAPVADCYFDLGSPVTGLRTFGSDPQRVGEFVAATVEGYREAGVLACVKHFPGHGSTPEDSHETLPEVKKSLDELRREDLIPFRRAIDAGVDMVMVSHVAFPLDGDALVPASFDGRIIKNLLRGEMGYEGVVITDALGMAGARWYAKGRGGALTGGFERSLLAGADLLLHTAPIPEAVEIEGSSEPVMSWNVMQTIIHTLEKVVDQSRIDAKVAEAARVNEPLRNILSILEESDERIGRLREKLEAQPPPAKPRTHHPKVVQFDAYPSEPAVYRDVAQASVALWKDGAKLQPLSSEERCVILPVEWSQSSSLGRQDLDTFLDVFCKHFPGWERTGVATGFVLGGGGEMYPDIPGGPEVIDATRYTGAQRRAVYDVPEDAGLVLVLSSRGIPPEAFLAGLQAFAERHEPAAVLLTGWPVTSWIPESSPALLCFGASAQVASAAAEIIAGNAQPEGNTDGLLPG